MSYLQNVAIGDIAKKYGADITFVSDADSHPEVGLAVAEPGGAIVNPMFYRQNDNPGTIVYRFVGAAREHSRGEVGIDQTLRFGSGSFVYRARSRYYKREILSVTGVDFIFLPGLDSDESDTIRPYAFLIGNFLHITHSVTRSAGAREAFRYAVDRALAILKRRKWKMAETPDDMRKAVAEFIRRTAAAEQERAQRGVRELQARINDLLDELPRYSAELEKMVAETAVVTSQRERRDKKTAEFIEYVASHAKVESCRVVNDRICLRLRNLHMTYDGKTVDLPTYDVTLNASGSSFQVKAPDLDGDNIHPHIFTDGNPCLGNYLTIYAKLIQNGEYCQILDLIVQYLETYNRESPALPWPDFLAALDNNGHVPEGSDDGDGDWPDDDE